MISRWLGRVGYGPTLERQRAQRDARLRGEVGDELWGLEHDPVVTTGRREASDLPPVGFFAERGIERFETERGGLATWHGPGQLVAYLIADVSHLGVKRTVSALEEGVISWLGDQGVGAVRRPGYPGVWVGTDKICAVGLHFRRGVSMHGIGLNLCNDLGVYDWFVACGIRDGGITSLERLKGIRVEPEIAWVGVSARLSEALRATPPSTVRSLDASGGSG